MPANYTHTSRVANAILTAAQYNSDHQNHINNMIPTIIDDYSVNVSEMRTQVDPGESGSESLATTLSGELSRARFAIHDMKRFIDPTLTYWYQTPSTSGQAFLNVKAHGVTGDGSTNDQSAIQTLLATGKNLYFPQGTYNVGSTLNLVTNGQQLRGEGSASIIKATGSGYNVFTVNASSVSNIGLHNFSIFGAATTDGTAQYGFFTDATHVATHLRVDNVIFSGPDSSTGLNNGIKLDTGSNYAVITRCTMDRLVGVISGTGYGVLLGTASYNTIAHNTFIGTSGKGRHAVYLSAGSTYNRVLGNHIDAFNKAGITADASNSQPTNAYNLIANNILRATNDNAADGAISTFRNDVGTIIAGNIIQGAVTNGILLDSQASTMSHITVEGNKVLFSGNFGILIRGVVQPMISGNHVFGSSVSSSGTYSDIDIRRDSTNAVTTSNASVVGNSCPTSTTNRAPLNVDTSAPTPTGITLKGNYFPAGTVSGVVYGTPTSASTNPIIDGAVTFVSGATAFTVTNPLINGTAYNQNFTVYGATSGDRVIATTNASISGLSLTGFVASADTVTLTLINMSGAGFTGGDIQVYITVLKTTV